MITAEQQITINRFAEGTATFSREQYLANGKRPILAETMGISVEEFDAAVEKARTAKPQKVTTLNWHDSDQPVEIVETPSLVRNLIYRGASTGLIAKPKVGKTTFAMDEIDAIVNHKKFLGCETTPVNVLYVTEQPLNSFQAELRNSGLVLCTQRRLDAGEDPKKLFYITIEDWFRVAWPDIVSLAGEKAAAVGAGLVAFDTLSRAARVKDENNASEMQAAVDELTPLHAADIAILLVQHERKAGGDIFDAGRGTNALTGAVDVLLRLTKMGGKGQESLRQLEYLGRFPGPALPLTLERKTLDERSRYEALKDGAAVKKVSAKKAVLDFLHEEGSPATREEIMKETGVTETTLRRALDDLQEEGLVRTTGDGSKEAPFRYAEVTVPE